MLSQPDKQYADDSDSGHHMWYSDGMLWITNFYGKMYCCWICVCSDDHVKRLFRETVFIPHCKNI